MTQLQPRRTTRTRPLARALRAGALAALVAAPITASITRAPRAGAATTAETAQAAGTLRVWYGSDDPTERKWAQGLATSFGTRRGVKVQFSFYSLDDMNQKTQLALNTPNAPDLIYTTPRGPGLPAYVRAGRLRDLSADARKHGWAGQLRSGLLDSYNRVLDANGTPARDAGKTYAVPYLVAADAVLYNKTVFAKLKLAVPRTQAQFEALLPRLKKAGYTPIGFGNQDGWVGDAWYLTLVNARVNPSSLRPALQGASSFSFAGAPFRQAAATLRGWATAGYFSPSFGGLDPQESVDDFFEKGRTAMQLVSSTENSQVLAGAGSDESKAKTVGVFAFPSARAGQPPVLVQDGFSGWAIPRAARNQAAALTFIDDMLSARTAGTLLAQGLLSARRVDAGGAAAPFQHDFLAALDSATPGVYLDAAPVPGFLATMEAQLQQLLAGKTTPAALTQALQGAYASHGRTAGGTDTDGEF